MPITNALKSGLRFSANAFGPSCASDGQRPFRKPRPKGDHILPGLPGVEADGVACPRIAVGEADAMRSATLMAACSRSARLTTRVTRPNSRAVSASKSHEQEDVQRSTTST